MLAAPSNPLKSSNDAVNKGNKTYQLSFDGFDSPFHTPSLFGSIKYNDFHGQQNKYDAFYSNNKDDFRSVNYQQSSPESFFSVMADLESSGTRTPSPNNDNFGDDFFKADNTTPPFLYNHQPYQRKVILPSFI